LKKKSISSSNETQLTIQDVSLIFFSLFFALVDTFSLLMTSWRLDSSLFCGQDCGPFSTQFTVSAKKDTIS